MRILYYPGCTLKTNAKNFEDATIASFKEIGVELKEMERWNCCGTVYSLTTDNLMYHLAAIRNLIRVQEQGEKKVTTLCSICYNTLKQANFMVKREEDKLQKINAFMDEEEDYMGEVEIIHPLEIARDKIEEIKKRVKKPLNMKVAAYYGCLLLRPKEIAIDDIEQPNIMENLIEALGGIAIDFPYKNECCGSYNVIDKEDAIVERTYRIISSAKKRGADAIIVSCPLCYFNLNDMKEKVKKTYHEFSSLPIYYFSELMAMAFGIKMEVMR
ncbi:MAG: heterodisulfide reductase, subunit B [Thermoplasmata archaeon]|nr:MAG: heterodisulfide reductase, subunit B [Thermoplasmata archaeon]